MFSYPLPRPQQSSSQKISVNKRVLGGLGGDSTHTEQRAPWERSHSILTGFLAWTASDSQFPRVFPSSPQLQAQASETPDGPAPSEGSRDLSLGSVTLLEQLTELGETLIFTWLLQRIF